MLIRYDTIQGKFITLAPFLIQTELGMVRVYTHNGEAIFEGPDYFGQLLERMIAVELPKAAKQLGITVQEKRKNDGRRNKRT